MNKRKYTGSFNFALEASLKVAEAGVTIGYPTTDIDKYKQAVGSKWDTANLALPDADGMVIPEGLQLKPENFLYVPFRLLSSTIVGAYTWKAADFSKAGVLRKGMRKLLTKGVYTNHNMRPENWLGYIAEVKWEKEKLQDGITIPAGINGVLAIDTTVERNKNVALGIIAGAIYSNSVSVEFEWEMSHNFEEAWDFRRKVGELGQDGKMVRRNVTKIVNFHETSLVSLGADPYAKRVDGEGNQVNIDTGSTYTELAKLGKKSIANFTAATEANTFTVYSGLTKDIIKLSGKPAPKADSTNKPEFKMNEKLKQALLAALGVTSLEDVTDEQVGKVLVLVGDDTQVHRKLIKTALVTVGTESITLAQVDSLEATKKAKLEELATSITNLTAKVVKADALKVTLTKCLGESFELTGANLTTLVSTAKYGTDMEKLQRDEVKKLARLKMGKNVDEVALEVYDTATKDQIQATLKSYGKGIVEGFNATCGACGSDKVKFVSSKATKEETKVGDKEVTTKSLNQIRDELANKSLRVGK